MLQYWMISRIVYFSFISSRKLHPNNFIFQIFKGCRFMGYYWECADFFLSFPLIKMLTAVHWYTPSPACGCPGPHATPAMWKWDPERSPAADFSLCAPLFPQPGGSLCQGPHLKKKKITVMQLLFPLSMHFYSHSWRQTYQEAQICAADLQGRSGAVDRAAPKQGLRRKLATTFDSLFSGKIQLC